VTLLNLFSSSRPGMAARPDSAVWPRDSHFDGAGRIVVGGVALTDIAERFGTSSCVLDEREVRDHCRAYRKLFPEAEIVYAGQALLVRAVANWVTEEGLSVAVYSADELAVALDAGIDPKRIIMHGTDSDCSQGARNNTADDWLQTAAKCRVGRIF
jgi:diaminopimelate decarboxylase